MGVYTFEDIIEQLNSRISVEYFPVYYVCVYCVVLQMLRAQNQLQKAINYDRLFCQFREHLLNASCVQITLTSKDLP